jgi:hypothetical protein
MRGDDFNRPSVERGVRRAAQELGQNIHTEEEMILFGGLIIKNK